MKSFSRHIKLFISITSVAFFPVVKRMPFFLCGFLLANTYKKRLHKQQIQIYFKQSYRTTTCFFFFAFLFFSFWFCFVCFSVGIRRCKRNLFSPLRHLPKIRGFIENSLDPPYRESCKPSEVWAVFPEVFIIIQYTQYNTY